MSRRRGAEEQLSEDAPAAQRRRTADLSITVKIGARDLLRLNPKALVEDAAGNEDTLEQLRKFGVKFMEQVQNAQAAAGQNKTRKELTDSNSCFACRKVCNSASDILKCQCYREEFGEPEDVLDRWVHLCRPCAEAGKLDACLCPGCHKLVCPGCSVHCQGKDTSRNCKKLFCMRCDSRSQGWDRCFCGNYSCCKDCKASKPNPDKVDGKCKLCTYLLCGDCEYVVCNCCEQKICEDHAVNVTDFEGIMETMQEDENYDDILNDETTYRCQQCVDEVGERAHGSDDYW